MAQVTTGHGAHVPGRRGRDGEGKVEALAMRASRPAVRIVRAAAV
jgi:hypothetical protein